MAHIGQVFPLRTLPKCSHTGIYQARRTLHLITVRGLFLLENAFLNSFIILAFTSCLAMISTIPLGEKLVLWYNLFFNLIFLLGTLDFLGCSHLFHSAQDFMCLHRTAFSHLTSKLKGHSLCMKVAPSFSVLFAFFFVPVLLYLSEHKDD